MWTKGPDLPNEIIQGHTCYLNGGDTGAALLTSGNVLLGANTLDNDNCPFAQIFFFEFDGLNLNPTPPTSEVTGAMLVLPTGQVLLTDAINLVNNPVIYTPAGYLQPPQGGPWAPLITSVSDTRFVRGQMYQVSGKRFNGMSQASMFGDDLQNATNYPLVRLSLQSFAGPTLPVTYCKTHDHTSMGVATGDLIVTTTFDVPPDIAPGNYYLEVVANGISSGYYGPFMITQ